MSLLIYFDRMSRTRYGDMAMSLSGGSLSAGGGGETSGSAGGGGVTPHNPRGFAIDSFNVHRLVIAGITVASKFFSDVFYTNSRYAKVSRLDRF